MDRRRDGDNAGEVARRSASNLLRLKRNIQRFGVGQETTTPTDRNVGTAFRCLSRLMHDHHQLEIPDSFMALYLVGGPTKPSATREQITTRYELCEDLANHLYGGVMTFSGCRGAQIGLQEPAACARTPIERA